MHMGSDPTSTDLVILESGALAAGHDGSRPVPAIVAKAGDRAARRFLEFFAVAIENPNTREAYYRACRRFFAWTDARGLKELVDIEPMHVAAYIKSMGGNFEKPTVKQHLAAIRMLFDWLVVGRMRAADDERGSSFVAGDSFTVPGS